ncbi:MAG: sensor histidine kinase [Oscillospiraceae bacterium]|nr:sensor histidine kinase [Oscillospiraceae bacterium]
MSRLLSLILSSLPETVLLLGALAIFFCPLPRRDRYGLRLVCCLPSAALFYGLLSMIVPETLSYLALPVGFLLFGVLVCLVLHETELPLALYLSIWAVLCYLIVLIAWEHLRAYGSYGGEETEIVGTVLRLLLTVCAYLPLMLTVRKWLPVYEAGHVGPRQTLSAVLIYIIFQALMTNFYPDGAFRQGGVQGVLIFLCQIYCVTILYLQTALFQKSAIRKELEIMNLMWHQHAEQYKLSKENIALINQKCHDLKHQVAAMRTMEGGQQREKYLKEIEDSVRIYDAIVKTNNDTLDTVLTEKSLLCEANNIVIHCVADGPKLNFMDPVDIYTVMGNALDNAIEAVMAFEEKEMRVIDVLIHERQGFLVIRVTNPLKRKLMFREGLPVSVKPDNGYHGVGLRSIQYTARKYGGELTVGTEDDCFSLRIAIPLSKN